MDALVREPKYRLEEIGPAPEAGLTPEPVPAVGPKNVYKRPVPQTSETETVTLPSADTFTLPKVVDEGAPPEPAPDTRKYKLEEIVPPAEEHGTASNIVRGIGERGLQLAGGVAGALATTAESVGDYLDQTLGKPVVEADGSFTWRRTTEAESAGASSWITQKLKEVSEGLKNPDLGYTPSTTWQDVKDAPFSNVLPFALETGVVSAPDMVAAIYAAPAYIGEQAFEIGTGRATNEGRTEATFGDMLKSLPSAVISQWMEKIGTSKILGLGEDAALAAWKELPADLLKTLVTEGATEAAQQAAQYTGEHAFTDKPIDWWQMAEESASAALVGAIFGPAARVPFAAVEVATAPKADDQPEVAADTQPEGTTAAATPDIGQPSPGGTNAATPPPPAGATPPAAATTPTVVPTGVDPAVAASLGQPAAAPGSTPDETAAAPPPIAATTGEGVLPEFDVQEETDTGEPVADAAAREERAARIRDLWKDQLAAEKAQEVVAATTQPTVIDKNAPTEDVIKAALADAAKAGKKPVQTETIGTGQALAPTPQVVNAPVPVPETPLAGPVSPPSAPPSLPEPSPSAVPAEAAAFGAPPPIAAEAAAAGPSSPAAVATPKYTLEPIEAAPVAPALDLVAPQAATVAGAKGVAFKRKKPITVVIPKKPATELIRPSEAAAAQPTPQIAPAAAPVAPRGRLHQDVGAHVRDVLERTSTVSELPEFGATVDAATDEEVASNPRGDRSPRQYIEEVGAKIATEVKRRLEAAQEAQDAGRIAAEEAASKPVKVQARETKKTEAEKKLVEGKPQERERAGKTGKSAKGITAESEKATRAAVAKEMEKPEAERSPALMRWAALHEEQVGLQKKPKEGEKRKTPAEITARREAIKAEKQQAQEERAGKVAAVEEEKGGLADRAADMKSRVEGVIDRVPMPGLGGTHAEQLRGARTNLRQFYDATLAMLKAAGKKLPAHQDRAAYSPEENLAIFAAKLIGKDADTTGQGAADWILARYYVDQASRLTGSARKDVLDSLYGTTTTEALRGGSEAADKRKGKSVEETELEYQAHHADETSLGTRVRGAEGEMVEAPDMLGRAKRRGGSKGARARSLADRLRDNMTYTHQTITVHPETGGPIQVAVVSQSAASALRDLNDQMSETDTGFMAVIRNTLIKHLIQLVGDVEVHFLSERDMMRIDPRNLLGIYADYTDKARAQGLKPQVYMPELLQFEDPDEYAHTLLHELVHAATAQALRHGLRGTDKVVASMRVELEKHLLTMMTREQMKAAGLDYAFTNNAEFIAEAFTNKDLQQLMSELRVPPIVQLQIAFLGKGRLASWFEAFTAAVSNAVGLFRGRQGMTYMENVISLQPHVFTSSRTQQARAKDIAFGKPGRGPRATTLPRAVPRGPLDVNMLAREQQITGESVRDRVAATAQNVFTPTGRRMRDWLSTTTEAAHRWSEKYGVNTPFQTLTELYLSKEPLMRRYRRSLDGTDDSSVKLEESLIKLKRDNRDQYDAMSQQLHDGSIAEVDYTVPLAHPNNKDVSKKGVLDEGQRAEWTRLNAAYNKLSPAAQAVTRAVAAHFRTTGDIETKKHITHSIEQALTGYHVKLPAGKTTQDAVDWVMSGGAERSADEQTADDKAWHTALGNTATTLAGIRGPRRIKGVYVPLTRRGRYFIQATEKMPPIPAGAIYDGDNRIVFINEKAARAYVGQFHKPLKIAIEWIDPATGEKINHQEPQARKQFVLKVQRKRFEASDNRAQLEKRRKQLTAEGHDVSPVGLSEKHLAQIVEQTAPAHIKRLLNNLKGSTTGNETVGQKAVKAAILDAHIRSMNTPGALTTRLKRNKVLGYDHLDLASSVRTYNRNLANHFANTDLAGKMAEADAALAKFIKEGGRNREYAAGDNTMLDMQARADELRHRISNTRAEMNVGWARAFHAVRSITMLKHLAGPLFSIMNAFQPVMQTFPHLSGRFGDVATLREMGRAYRAFGVFRLLGKGLADTWSAGKNLDLRKMAKDTGGDNDAYMRQLIGRQPDGAELQEVFDKVVDQGFGASGSMEAPAIAEEDQNSAERLLGRMVQMAMAFPSIIEGINRYTTATAAYRLARQSGGSHEEATAYAVRSVERTQGGYGAANNPAIFANPYAAAPLQFRKYSLAYGQMFYGSTYNSFAGATPQVKREARRTLVRMAGMSAVFAGLGGTAFAEIAKMMVDTAFLFGLTDDDWDETETGIQQWLKGYVGGTLSEAMIRGAPRLFGADMSGAMGADNLVLFGQPRHMTSEGTADWLFKMLIGAPGSMGWDMLKDISNGDYLDAIPMPKIIDNMIKAYGLSSVGTVSKQTGEEYAPPISAVETGMQLLGIKPASVARQWEGGTGSKAKQLHEISAAKQNLMGRWRAATPQKRQQIFSDEVSAWNKTHTGHDRITLGGLYQSVKRAKERRKQLQEEQ